MQCKNMLKPSPYNSERTKTKILKKEEVVDVRLNNALQLQRLS